MITSLDAENTGRANNEDLAVKEHEEIVTKPAPMKKQFTLKQICDLAGIEVPEEFQNKKDETISHVVCLGGYADKGCAYFELNRLENGGKASYQYNLAAARRAAENGASYFFCTAPVTDKAGNPLPCIVLDDPRAVYIKICKQIRNQFPENSITMAVTGSVGKTTTKEMLNLIAQTQYKTHFSRENANGFVSISNYIQKLPSDTEVYIQEVGAFYPGLVEADAQLLEPNACIITNISTPHIDLYGSIDNILYDKLALVRHMKPDGMAFLNMDDPRLAELQPDCNVTWFSVDNPKADFHAENIEYMDGYMQFDIVGKGKSTKVQIHSYGIHNIINAIAAFAFGSWLKIPETVMATALGEYKAVGLRQNLENIGGYRLYVDCYNAAPNSMVGAVQTIMRIPVPEGNQRIAVFGDIPRMGDMAAEVHIKFGQDIAKYDLDWILCYGTDIKYTADELKRSGRKVLYTKDRKQLNQWIVQKAKVGDLLLFKASHPTHLAKTIDQIFGTSYHITDGDVITSSGRNIQTQRFTGKAVDGMVEIRKCLTDEERVVVPSHMNDIPVYRIGADSFNRKRTMQELVISEGIVNIGVAAFYICTKLTRVTFPSTLKVIERSAFNYCTALEEAYLPDSVISINRRAFYDCHALKKIVIGPNTNFIGSEAFTNCKDLTIYGVSGSYAEAYAKKEGIPFRPIEEPSEH